MLQLTECPPDTTKKCPVDVVFIFDSSASIDDDDFDAMLNETAQFVQSINQTESPTRFALVTFSTQVTLEFGFDNFSTPEEVADAVRNVTSEKGLTDTAGGIRKAVELFENEKDDVEKDRKRVVLIVTDGSHSAGSFL